MEQILWYFSPLAKLKGHKRSFVVVLLAGNHFEMNKKCFQWNKIFSGDRIMVLNHVCGFLWLCMAMYVTLKCCGGHAYGTKYLKIGIGCFFVPTYQMNPKHLKKYNSSRYFHICLISWPMYVMAHPVCDQIWQKFIQTLILTSTIILRRGHDILQENGDFL